MSALTQLRQLAEISHSWVHSGQTIPELLHNARLAIREALPDAQDLWLYRLMGENWQLTGTTRDTADLSPDASSPDYPHPLSLRLPRHDAERERWLVPLVIGARPLGLLVIAVPGAPPPGQSSHEEEWLELCGALIAQALALRADTDSERATPSQISARQKNALNEMVMGQTLITMTGILARHLLPDGRRQLTLYELDRDERGNTTGWRVTFNQYDPAAQLNWADLTETARLRLIDSETYYPLPAEDSPVSRWVRQHERGTAVFFPIMSGGLAIAVLLVTSPQPDALTDEETNALESLCAQMGVLVQVQSLLEDARAVRFAVDNLALANRLVTVAADLAYMAQGIIYTVAREMTAVAVALFDRPLAAHEMPSHRRLMGLATLDEILPVDDTITRSDLPDREGVSSLRGSLPVIVSPLDGDESYFSERTRADYAALGAQWAASFGIRAGELLLGTLDILNSQPHALTQSDIDSYTTLADQIGATIRSRQLFEESQRAQALAAQLLHINSMIAAAQDYQEMAQVVIESLPESIAMVGILLLDDAISVREMPQSMRAEVMATRAGVETPGVTDALSASNYAAVHSIKTLIDGELLFEPDYRKLKDNPIPNICAYLTEHGLYSFAAVGLRTGARLLGAIAFIAESSSALESLSLQNLKAIAGQVAIAVENRNLLNQTADALSFVAAQYEMSNALFRARSNRDMVNVLYRFGSEMYDNLQFGIVSDDGEKVNVTTQITPEGAPQTEFDDQTLFVHPVPEALRHSEDGIVQSDDLRELILPLYRRDGSLIAVLTFTHPEPVSVPFNQIRALRSLADQMAVLLENRYLLQQTDKALTETRTLYEMTQSLVGAQDALSILEAIRTTIADRAHTLALLNLNTDPISDQFSEIELQALVTPDGAQRARLSLLERLTPDELEDFQKKWRALGDQINFNELIRDMPNSDDPLYSYLREQGIKLMSSVIIPVSDGEELRHQIHIGFHTPNLFTDRDRRLYVSLRDQARVVLENQRLLRDISTGAAELGQQVRVLQAINQLAASLATVRDEAELMNEAALALVTALRVDHVGITLLNPDQLSATVVGEYPAAGAVGVFIPGDNPLQEKIRNSRQPIIIQDIDHEAEIAPDAVEAMRQIGVRSVMFYPMVDQRGVYMGSIGLDVYQKGYSFDSQVLEITRTIAAQVIISLQNIRQLRGTQRQADQLQRLAQLSQSAQTSLDRDNILEMTVIQTPQIVTADHVNFYEIDLDRREPWLRFQLDGDQVNIWDVENAPPVTIAPTLLYEVWQSREQGHVPDSHAADQPFHSTDPERLRSVMVAPIVTRGVVRGLLEIGREVAYGFTETDAIIFRQLANQISVAIENADAYTQTQRIARSKALVNEISSQLQQQVEFEDILNVTMNELGTALRARRGRIRLRGTGEEQSS